MLVQKFVKKSTLLLNVAALAFSTFSVSSSLAGTRPIFSRDGKTGTVLLQGMPGDLDAPNFYNLLIAPPVEDRGKWTKKVTFSGPDGVKAFDFVCAYSKMIRDNGSCVLVFHVVENLTVGSGRITYRVTGETAERLAKLFVILKEAHEIYRSSDHHLTMNVETNSSDQKISLFILEYR